MSEKTIVAPEGQQAVVEAQPAPEGEQTQPPVVEPAKAVVPTVPLSDFHSMKDTLSRLVGDSPERLKAIAEEDPRLAERIKEAFPKRFNDVDLSAPVTPENLDARVAQAVNEALEGSSNRNALGSMREQLGMTEIEFSDIEEKLDNTAKALVKNETAKTYVQALGVALSMVNPKLAEDMAANKATEEAARRIEQASGGSAQGQQASEKSQEQSIEGKFDKNLPPTYSTATPK